MKPKQPKFSSAEELSNSIDSYFKYIEGEYYLDEKEVKGSKSPFDMVKYKVWTREAEPATIAGLAFFLGFNSKQSFNDYEARGKLADTLKRGRLRVEAEYEKKLHFQSSTGAIFALKSLGWNEKPEVKETYNIPVKTIKIELIECGPQLVANEKDVIL